MSLTLIWAFVRPYLLPIIGVVLAIAGFFVWLAIRDGRMMELGKQKIRAKQAEEVEDIRKKDKDHAADLRDDSYDDLIDKL